MGNYSRRINSLQRIKIDGVCLTEKSELRQGVLEAFKKILSDQGGRVVESFKKLLSDQGGRYLICSISFMNKRDLLGAEDLKDFRPISLVEASINGLPKS